MTLQFNHPEAWALMSYQTPDRRARERLWNSRDGVTPFIVRSKGEALAMEHVAYSCDPAHIPEVGDRIFVDATIEDLVGGIARNLIVVDGDEQSVVAAHWDDGKRESDQRTFRQIVDDIARAELTRNLSPPPHLVVVTFERREALTQTVGERVAEARSKGWAQPIGKRYA